MQRRGRHHRTRDRDARWSVALLEARRIAWNTSRRNCGFVPAKSALSQPV
jgi:hypothetical protein